jgi:aryl-alcohol dehydrogenase-like predicted oxidoreductase
MDYTTLTGTGLEVSPICLGCLNFGSGLREDWNSTVGEEQSIEIIERAIDLGINYFDTANVYSTGESEEILGKALDGYDRDWPVVATKVNGEMDPGNPNASGLSRKAIEQELEHSLDRLGMDTVDLYQIHRWDDDTPIEETLRTLDDCVRRGKVRYIGASSMWAYQFADALHTSDELGLERFATMQNHYNLVYREEEREMLPLCEKEDVGVVPWSPLARGYLAYPHDDDELARDDEAVNPRPYRDTEGNVEINERVAELAEEKGVSMAQISIAWHLHKEWVDAPIVGVETVEHVEEAVEATEVDLADSDLAYLEEPYEPTWVSGHE